MIRFALLIATLFALSADGASQQMLMRNAYGVRGAAASSAGWTPQTNGLIYYTTFELTTNRTDWAGDTNLIFGTVNRIVRSPINTVSYDFWWTLDGSSDPNKINVKTNAMGNISGSVKATAAISDFLRQPAIYNTASSNYTNWPSLTNWSLAVWVLRNQTGDGRYIDGTASPDLLVDASGSNTRFYFGNVDNAPAISTGVWTHIAMTYDYTAQKFRGWINGTNYTTRTENRIAGLQAFALGCYGTTSAGMLMDYDDLCIWTNAITTNDIMDIYNHGSPATRAQ